MAPNPKQTAPNLQIVNPKQANRATKTSVDTLEITHDVLARWKAPPFQRPLKINEKVRQLSALIAETGVIPGMLTLGVLDGVTYLMDGQHRVEAYRLTDLPVVFADVRVHHVETMGEMGEEFVALNSCLVKFTPDDILRGLEASNEALRLIRARCPFVGYDQIRRGDNKSPVLSMSMLIRCWDGAGADVPDRASEGISRIVDKLGTADAEALVEFAKILFDAWGRDTSANRLWGSLNLCVLGWFYRHAVLAHYSPRVPKMPKDLFKKCCMALGADASYSDWLVGRNSASRDRSPCYQRMVSAFKQRIEIETKQRPILPSPAWLGSAHSR
jgi:hypothetical protein